MEELVSLKNVKGHDENPFIVELKGKMYLQPRANTIIAKGQGITDLETGEIIQDDVLIGKRKVVDKSQFAKIYASEISILFGLSKTAINVLVYFMKVMDYDNKVLFDYRKEFKKLGYKTEIMPLKGLRELLTKNIIAAHTISSVYWINPTIVCKGERFAMYTEIVTKERHEKDMINSEKNLILKKQSYEKMQSLDDKTTSQINAMNAIEENKYISSEMRKQMNFDSRQLEMFSNEENKE